MIFLGPEVVVRDDVDANESINDAMRAEEATRDPQPAYDIGDSYDPEPYAWTFPQCGEGPCWHWLNGSACPPDPWTTS